jgi:alkylhydroperoxidase family enzyme
MTTLRAPQLADFSPEDRAILERIANRMGRPAEELLHPRIFGVQAHWPAWLAANFDHSLATYMRPGILPQIAKEAMHAAVSMTNKCEY